MVLKDVAIIRSSCLVCRIPVQLPNLVVEMNLGSFLGLLFVSSGEEHWETAVLVLSSLAEPVGTGRALLCLLCHFMSFPCPWQGL